jgi:hypothetical protein
MAMLTVPGGPAVRALREVFGCEEPHRCQRQGEVVPAFMGDHQNHIFEY